MSAGGLSGFDSLMRYAGCPDITREVSMGFKFLFKPMEDDSGQHDVECVVEKDTYEESAQQAIRELRQYLVENNIMPDDGEIKFRMFFVTSKGEQQQLTRQELNMFDVDAHIGKPEPDAPRRVSMHDVFIVGFSERVSDDFALLDLIVSCRKITRNGGQPSKACLKCVTGVTDAFTIEMIKTLNSYGEEGSWNFALDGKALVCETRVIVNGKTLLPIQLVMINDRDFISLDDIWIDATSEETKKYYTDKEGLSSHGQLAKMILMGEDGNV